MEGGTIASQDSVARDVRDSIRGPFRDMTMRKHVVLREESSHEGEPTGGDGGETGALFVLQ